MKFIVDAQLPRQLAVLLNDKGHDAIHTFSLPYSDATEDAEITKIADKESRIVISKDSDFLNSHLLNSSPKKLLLISTGNMVKATFLNLVEARLPSIVTALEKTIS